MYFGVGEFLVDFLKSSATQKKPQHLAGYGREGSSQSCPRVWKRLRVEGFRFRHCVAKVPRLRQGDEAHEPLDTVGVGPTSPGFARKGVVPSGPKESYLNILPW